MIRGDKIATIFSLPISWVLLAGFGLRIYSAAARCVVNPDAHHYIYQAKVIFSGAWSELFSCGLQYLSTYPFFTAMAYALIRDWVTAGVVVNVFFGTVALVPLYFLLRRFLDQTVSALGVLVLAFIPTFVNSSGDIVRDPVFWFFITAGMLFFARRCDPRTYSRDFRRDLILSSLCFALATITRIEGLLFVVASPLYLIISRNENKGQKLLFYFAPLVFAATTALIIVHFSDADAATALRVENVWREATQFVERYGLLDARLKIMVDQNDNLFGEFLHRTREALWLMPLAVLLHNIIEVFFYPYTLIFFIGFIGLRRHLENTPQAKYLLCLMVGSIAILVVHLCQTWIFIHRFLVILILPSCLVIAWGVENAVGFLKGKYHLRPATAAALVAAFIVLFGLPKNLIPRETDKAVYRQAARIIQEDQSPLKKEGIGAAHASKAYEWVLLYANRRQAAPLCAKHLVQEIPTSYARFLRDFDQAGMSYFIYEERYWPKKRFDLLTAAHQQDFNLIGQWEHRDSGKLMIFRRINK